MKKPTLPLLLVEHNKETIKLFQYYFGKKNYEVRVTDTCTDSLAMARSEAFSFYLIGDPIDYRSTADLCQDIRGFDFKTPIIFCSAEAYPVSRLRALQAGAQAYLTKPCNIEELQLTIDQFTTAAFLDIN